MRCYCTRREFNHKFNIFDFPCDHEDEIKGQTYRLSGFTVLNAVWVGERIYPDVMGEITGLFLQE